MADKHTPTPWATEVDTCAKCREEGTEEFIFSPGPDTGLHGAVCGRADAEFIVRAVNHHEELVEALKQAESGHEYTTPAGATNCKFCDNCMDHEGTFEDMHADDCVIKGIRAVLKKGKDTTDA